MRSTLALGVGAAVDRAGADDGGGGGTRVLAVVDPVGPDVALLRHVLILLAHAVRSREGERERSDVVRCVHMLFSNLEKLDFLGFM